MCWMAAIPIAMMGAQALSSNMSGQQAAGAQATASRLQNIETLKQMNIQDANLRLEERDLLDSTIQEMTQGNMNRVRNMGTIRAAIGEGMLEGQSMDRVANVTEGDFLREQTGLTDNYQRDYSKILGQRLGNQQSALSQIEMSQKTEAKGKSPLEMILDPLAMIGGKGAEMYMSGAFKGQPKAKAAPNGKAKGSQ